MADGRRLRKIAISQPRFDRFQPNLARQRSLALLSRPTVKNWTLEKCKMATAVKQSWRVNCSSVMMLGGYWVVIEWWRWFVHRRTSCLVFHQSRRRRYLPMSTMLTLTTPHSLFVSLVFTLLTFLLLSYYLPTAVAYSMEQMRGQTDALCVCMSTLSRSHFMIDFRQKWHRGNNPQK